MFKPGQSGNPNGRKRGIVDKRTRYRQTAEKDVPEILAMLATKAKGGDVDAAKTFLDFTMGKPKPEATRRKIALDPSLALEHQGRSVVKAIACGDLAPDEGAALLNGLARQGELEKLGLLADVVAALAARSGIEVPPELKLRQRIPATINNGSAT
jgi:Family of unknown function (DUF5681)